MSKALSAIDVGLIALDAGIDKANLFNTDINAGVHLFCAVALAVVGVYIAQPVVAMLRRRAG